MRFLLFLILAFVKLFDKMRQNMRCQHIKHKIAPWLFTNMLSHLPADEWFTHSWLRQPPFTDNYFFKLAATTYNKMRWAWPCFWPCLLFRVTLLSSDKGHEIRCGDLVFGSTLLQVRCPWLCTNKVTHLVTRDLLIKSGICILWQKPCYTMSIVISVY